MTKPLTIDEVAARWRVSRDTVIRAIKSGRLVAYKVGQNYRIMPEDLQAWELANQRKIAA